MHNKKLIKLSTYKNKLKKAGPVRRKLHVTGSVERPLAIAISKTLRTGEMPLELKDIREARPENRKPAPDIIINSKVPQKTRQKGITSTSIDMPQDQAQQSGMSNTSVHSLPGCMQYTYHDWPKSHKFAERSKKEIMPDTKSKEPTIQYRKPIKSLNSIKSLINIINGKSK